MRSPVCESTIYVYATYQLVQRGSCSSPNQEEKKNAQLFHKLLQAQLLALSTQLKKAISGQPSAFSNRYSEESVTFGGSH